jgi:hypothetical protein
MHFRVKTMDSVWFEGIKGIRGTIFLVYILHIYLTDLVWSVDSGGLTLIRDEFNL